MVLLRVFVFHSSRYDGDKMPSNYDINSSCFILTEMMAIKCLVIMILIVCFVLFMVGQAHATARNRCDRFLF